jgi:hypothetical protein
MMRAAVVAALIGCFGAIPAIQAQTLQSITITGFVPTPPSTTVERLSTGATATLTAIGTFSDGSSQPILANWSSSNSSQVSVDSATGTVTGFAGTVIPVAITATSGTISSSVMFTVAPQTAIYGVDGNDNLYIYDNTQVVINGDQQNTLPPLVTSFQYENTTKGINGIGGIVPMALSPDQRYLFIANPATTSSTASDFVITVIDTQNNYATVQTVSTGSGTNVLTDVDLCYPTSITVGLSSTFNVLFGTTSTTDYLFVVNAGVSVTQGSNTGCSSTGRDGNVQVFSINEGSSAVLQFVGETTAADLANPSAGNGVTGNYAPLLVAGSSDQNDQIVYVAWTENYKSTGTGPGIITPILTSAVSTDTPVNSVIPLSSGTTTNGFNISPLTLAVATTYPSWNGSAVHTVLYTGAGYNTALGSSSYSNNPSWGYFSDACDTTIEASCLTYAPSSPQSIYAGGPAGPFTYSAMASTSSPSGYVYAVDQTAYLEYFNPIAIPDTSTGQPLYAFDGFTTTAGDYSNCAAEGCLALSAISSRADDSSLYLTTTGSGFYAVSPTPLSGAPLQVNTSAPPLLGLVISQAPEVQLFLNQSGQNILGENSSTYFTVKGNFQNQIGGTTYALSCAWGAGQPTWSADQSISSATGGTVYPQLLPSYASGTFNAQVTPAVTDANQTNGSIITGISVGPVTSLISSTSPTVAVGGQDQLTSVVSNAASDGAIASWYINGATCAPGGTNACPFGYVDSNRVYNAPSVVSSSPMAVQICALPAAINNSSPGYGNAPCTNATISYTANSATVTAGSPYSNTITVNVVSPIATVNATSLTFGAAVGTTSSSQSVTLSNTGQAPLNLSDIAIAPAPTSADPGDFAIASGATECTASTILAAANANGTGGGTCSIYVTFTPAAAGLRTAVLQITDNSNGTVPQTVTLSGTGEAPTGTLSAPSLTFGAPVGTTSGAQSVTLTNTGQAPLNLSSVGIAPTPASADPGDFAISSGGNQCTASTVLVAASANGTGGGSCSIYVTFTPAAAGSRTAVLQITDDSGEVTGTVQSVALNGTGEVPSATLSAPSLTFSAPVGSTSSAQSVMLTNTGQAPLNVSAVAIAPTPTSADPGDFAIATTGANQCTASTILVAAGANGTGGGSCSIYVTFTPGAAGQRTAALQITDNSGEVSGTIQTVTLTGTGQAPTTPTATLTTSSLTFSTPQAEGTTSGALTVMLANTGQTALVLSANPLSIMGANPGDFAIASGTTCTASLSLAAANANGIGGGSCVIAITFKPGATGQRTATLQITDNSGGTAGATQTVTLTGTGVTPLTPIASLSTLSLTFIAPQTVGTTSAAQTVMLTNTGQAAMVLSATPLSIIGTNPGDFAIASGTSCTASLSLAAANANGAGGGSCVAAITFTPSATGPRTATLQITDNSGGTAGTTQSVTLNGAGISATATLSTSSLAFTTPQTVGTTSAAQTVMLTNTGQAALVLSAVPLSIIGTNLGDFALGATTTCTTNLSLAAAAVNGTGGGSCVISVTFTPGAGGQRTATLQITDNSGEIAGTTQSVALTGSGVAAAATLSTMSLTFTTPQTVGTTSAEQTVMLTNTGQAALVLSAAPLSIQGTNSGDFATASGTTCTAGLSLAAAVANGTGGGSCAISVTFTPGAGGQRTATLQITDNSGEIAGATQNVTLTGTGQVPVTISLYPSTPALEPGSTQTFTALFQPTSGAGPVTWTVTGTGCGGNPCGTINSSGTYTAPPTLAGPAIDTVTATLVSDQAIGGSTQVTLFLKPSVSSGQSETVTAGGTATYHLSLAAGTGNAKGALTVECYTETLPTGVGCQSLTIQPSGTATPFTFVVQTTGPGTAAMIPANRIVLAGVVLVFPLWLLPFLRIRRCASWLQPTSLVLLVFLAATGCFLIGGCGTGGSFGQTTPKTFTSTPSGTYTIQLIGVEPGGAEDSDIGNITLVVQ